MIDGEPDEHAARTRAQLVWHPPGANDRYLDLPRSSIVRREGGGSVRPRRLA